MLETLRNPVVAVLVVVAVVAGGLFVYDEASAWGQPEGATVTVVDSTETDGGQAVGSPNGGNCHAGQSSPGGGDGATGTAGDSTDGSTTTVAVCDEDGTTLGTVSVRVADTFRERYTGLSNTESLGPNEGMLFVHDEEGEHAYVMRDMAFPIDIVFVDANRTITAIHHAETESRPYTKYRGRGKYVLEVPYQWTTEHGVEVGDRVRIDWANGTTTETASPAR